MSGTSLYNESSVFNQGLHYQGDGNPTLQNLMGIQPIDLRVDSIFVVSNDVIDRIWDLYIKTAEGTDIQVGSVNVPAGAGTLAAPRIDLIDAIGLGQLTGLLVPRGWQVDVGQADGVTNTLYVDFLLMGGTL